MAACASKDGEIAGNQQYIEAAVSQRRTKYFAIAAYLLCALIWGTTWFAIRVCVGPSGYPIFEGGMLRYYLATAVMAFVWFALRCKADIPLPSRRQIIIIAGAGVMGGIALAFLHHAEQHISGGVAAVICSTMPLMAAVLAIVTRTERVSRGTIVGLLIAGVGIAMVFHDRLNVSAQQASAAVLLLITPFLNACSNVFIKRISDHVSPVATTTVFCLGAASVLTLMACLMGWRPLPPIAWNAPTMALVYLSLVGTVIAFASYYYLLKHVTLMTASTLVFVHPVFAMLVDAVYEKEIVLSPESYVGMVIALVGVALSIVLRSRAS